MELDPPKNPVPKWEKESRSDDENGKEGMSRGQKVISTAHF
jgi:hypothetical protein